jgi:hypothetical protein
MDIYFDIKLIQIKCFFLILMPGFTRVSLLKSESGFENVTQLSDTEK